MHGVGRERDSVLDGQLRKRVLVVGYRPDHVPPAHLLHGDGDELLLAALLPPLEAVLLPQILDALHEADAGVVERTLADARDQAAALGLGGLLDPQPGQLAGRPGGGNR